MQYNTKKRKVKYGFNFGEKIHVAFPRTRVAGIDVQEVHDIPDHQSSKCWVLEAGPIIALQSYDTIVCIYNRETCEYKYSKHSPTTSKQQSWFNSHLAKDYNIIPDFKEIVDYL